MNRPDKAGEPSMEEILASIRQIIADEPATDQPEPVIEPNPLVPQAHEPKAPEPRAPLADRLNNVLKSGPLPPTSPLGSKRPLSFDQDLADMFDEQEEAGGPLAAPKPDLRVPPGLSHPMARKSFVPHPGEQSAKPTADGAAALPPQLAPSEPLVPPPPFGGSSPPEKPAAETPPPAFGFPPLRKASFYPPQPKAPTAPAQAASAPQPAAPGIGPAAKAGPFDLGSGAPHVSPAGGEGGSPRVGGGIGAPAPGAAPVAADAGPKLGPAPFSDPAREAKDATAVAQPGPVNRGAAPETAAPVFASAPPPSAASAPSPSAASAPPPAAERSRPAPGSPAGASVPPYARASTDVGHDPVPPPQPADPGPAEPRPFAGPFTGTPPASSGFGGASRFAAEPDPSSSAAAHQALDALAQGLAASAAASAASIAPEAASPAIALTPVVEPEPSPQAAPQPSTLPATVSPAASNPGTRTLEDAVADMLRPMLQQWVAENMPRIIERALRTEVAAATRPGQKPPGT